MSHGGAYVHNLMAGRLNMSPHSRVTPYHLPHSTEIAGYHELLGGDDRFINNIFLRECELNIKLDNPSSKSRLNYGKEDFGLSAYNGSAFPVIGEGNVYFNGASPLENETNSFKLNYAPTLLIEENDQGISLSFDVDRKSVKMRNRVVTTESLGKAKIPGQGYTNPDGSEISIDIDYSGITRNHKNPTPGPFEKPGAGKTKLKVWPRQH
jgi:hypothetical protein